TGDVSGEAVRTGADVVRSAPRRALRGEGRRLADPAFRGACTLFATAILVLVALMFEQVVTGSRLSIARFGFGFFIEKIWDPVAGRFGAAAFVFGTVMSSFIALLLAVPFGVGIAVFLVEMAPQKVRS